jgi:hypothetical protein
VPVGFFFVAVTGFLAFRTILAVNCKTLNKAVSPVFSLSVVAVMAVMAVMAEHSVVSPTSSH